MKKQFSLVIPTYHEVGNIGTLLSCLTIVLKDWDYEIIVVDDHSTDGTREIVENFSHRNTKIKLITRLHEKGLSSAVLKGFSESAGTILGVMDADLSHDPKLLPEMISLIETDKADCVAGSRNMQGGAISDWPWYRYLFSRTAAFFAKILSGVSVTDPTSGYFCISRSVYETGKDAFKGRGYKILLEILVKGKPKKVIEKPFVFQDRKAGESKLSSRVMIEFFIQLCELLVYRVSHS